LSLEGPVTNPPESAPLARLVEQDALVGALFADQLAPDERVEAWYGAPAYGGPRSWSDLLPYILGGFWLQFLGRVIATPWRRFRAVVGLDALVYHPVPYVLMVLTDRRLLSTRFEAGRTLLDQPGGVRAIGETRSATSAEGVDCSSSFGQRILALDGAPDTAVAIPKGVGPMADATQQRGSALLEALEQRGWLAKE